MSSHWLRNIITTSLPSATKLRRLCFYRCVSVHRRGVCSGGCLLWGDVCYRGSAPGVWGGCLLWGVCSGGGLLWGVSTLGGVGVCTGGSAPGGVCCWGVSAQGGLLCTEAASTGETATAADGTHPIGMHSCFFQVFALVKKEKYITTTKLPINTADWIHVVFNFHGRNKVPGYSWLL